MTGIAEDGGMVWIAFHDGGGEGASEPLRAFESQELADIWLMGAGDTYGSGAKVVCLPVLRAANSKTEAMQ